MPAAVVSASARPAPPPSTRSRDGDGRARAGMWHHVDAAYAGTAMVCPELRHLQDGLERSTPTRRTRTSGCSRTSTARRSGSPTGSRCSGAVGPAGLPARRRVGVRRGGRLPRLARPAGPALPRAEADVRAAVLRRRGAPPPRARHLRLAAGLADGSTPTRVSSSSHRCRSRSSASGSSPGTLRPALADAVNASGRFAVTPSELPDGTAFVRVSVGQTTTQQRHVDDLWAVVAAQASR